MNNDLIICDGILQLSQRLVHLLNARAGDRIVIGYTPIDNELKPAITIGESGNKLSKKWTVVFKGKQRDTLAQYGTIFEAIEGTPIILNGNNPEFKVFAATNKKELFTLSKEIVTDTNYNLKIYNTYEF